MCGTSSRSPARRATPNSDPPLQNPLLGIANTVALSVHERTGELGLLRAIGRDRRQLRSMISFEAAIVAALGTALGLVLALFFSWTLSSGAAQPRCDRAGAAGRAVRWAAAAGIAAMLAAAIPARRAARLDVDAVRR